MYARPIRQLIEAFAKLPGVGARTAERYAAHLLKSGRREVKELADALEAVVREVKSCAVCWDFSDASPCAICADQRRDPAAIAVVAEPHDVRALERSGAYRGRYHILRGLPDPTDEATLAGLKIRELVARLADRQNIREVILAFNPDVAGETTMLYLDCLIRAEAPHIRVTRLARGLPMGSDLRYADDITLGSALKHRTEMR
jgi:recombination protein RecR